MVRTLPKESLPTSGLRAREPGTPSPSLRVRGSCGPPARARVGLLGPCFKTGRPGPPRRRPWHRWGWGKACASPCTRAPGSPAPGCEQSRGTLPPPRPVSLAGPRRGPSRPRRGRRRPARAACRLGRANPSEPRPDTSPPASFRADAGRPSEPGGAAGARRKDNEDRGLRPPSSPSSPRPAPAYGRNGMLAHPIPPPPGGSEGPGAGPGRFPPDDFKRF